MALNEFEGTVMLVSHDRALLRAVCDEFWMVGRGAVGPFDGDLDDYQRYLLDEAKRQRELAKQEAKQEARQEVAPAAKAAITSAETDTAKTTDPREQRKQEAQLRQQLAQKLRPFKRELEQVEQRMATLGTERSNLEQRMTQPLAPADIAEVGRKLKGCNDEIGSLEERWLELSAQIEAHS